MKRKERWLALIRTDEANDREVEFGEPKTAAVLIPTDELDRVLEWYVAMSAEGQLPMLPRDFELTLVPGPDGDQ